MSKESNEYFKVEKFYSAIFGMVLGALLVATFQYFTYPTFINDILFSSFLIRVLLLLGGCLLIFFDLVFVLMLKNYIKYNHFSINVKDLNDWGKTPY